jgi:hypothetical protein
VPKKIKIKNPYPHPSLSFAQVYNTTPKVVFLKEFGNSYIECDWIHET